MKCSEAKKLISAYVDGQLEESGVERLRLHLDACQECSLEEQSQRKLTSLLDMWESEEPSGDFQELLHRLPEKQKEQSGAKWLFPIPQWAAAGLVIVTVGLGVGAGAVFESQEGPVKPSQQQVASAIDLVGYDDSIEAGLLMETSANSSMGGAR